MLMELSRREKAANIKPDADIDAFMKARSRGPVKKVYKRLFFQELKNNLIIKHFLDIYVGFYLGLV